MLIASTFKYHLDTVYHIDFKQKLQGCIVQLVNALLEAYNSLSTQPTLVLRLLLLLLYRTKSFFQEFQAQYVKD
jgi:hypothetical protein